MIVVSGWRGVDHRTLQKSNNMARYIMPFAAIGIGDVPLVGGKNASLGEMFNQLSSKGIRVPDGFAVTAQAFQYFTERNNITKPIADTLAALDTRGYTNLRATGAAARKLVLEAAMPEDLAAAIVDAYRTLCGTEPRAVAVRSSATAEDLPQASFAGQHESYLNVNGEEAVLAAVKNCFASLYTDRAIKYREDNGFEHGKVLLSVGVQLMVRSDSGCSGVGFTLEPESGFRDVIHLSGVWGLGENIVQGTVSPDEFLVFKPALKAGKRAIIRKDLGAKQQTMVYGETGTVNKETPAEMRSRFVLADEEVLQLAKWALAIEEHYAKPMDIEWARDGENGDMYIVQARPETVHSQANSYTVTEYQLEGKGDVLVTGQAVGTRIAAGHARRLSAASESDKVQEGDIVVTELTSPDWDPILKKAAAIVTEKGGRTSHASIVARELGIPAIVGAEQATTKIADGALITVSCAEGKTGRVYEGKLNWKETQVNAGEIAMPEKTKVMLIAGDPDKAFKLSFYPNDGVGLMRIEFIINHSVGIHPMALVGYDELKDEAAKQKIAELTQGYEDKKQFFIDKLAQGVATIAAAFYPKDVIVRMSDFKTNEYAHLLGGGAFEPKEENPMIGFRGASRYYNPRYKEGFRLECEAMKVVRNEMGLTNVKLMIPFCRTAEEGKKVVAVMDSFGLKRGENGLEIYVMAEIPSNVAEAEELGAIFDGFSIGSNDLTQLTLGIDRDSALVADLFSEQNKAPKELIATVIKKANSMGRKIGLCGQAPSDHPEFAAFLVELGIDSISFNPDALLQGIENIRKAEQAKHQEHQDEHHMKRLKGRTAIVTGAAGGMGKAIAILFAQEGANVMATDIQEDKLQDWVTQAQAGGLRIDWCRHDVTTQESWQAAIDKTVAVYGGVQVLINNAGVYPAGATAENTTKEQWDRIIAVNLTGPFIGSDLCIPHMKNAGGGSIVNISSIAGIVGGNGPAYSASKGGLRLLTKDMAVELARYGIRVNSIHPGGVLTPMTEGLLSIPNADELMKNMCPMGRIGQAQEIAYGALYLASDESSYTTGAELVIDGGLVAR